MLGRLLGGAGASVAVPAIASTHPVHKHLAAAGGSSGEKAGRGEAPWKPEFMDPHQNETLVLLAEKIVPGSTHARVNRFLDVALGVDSQENQKNFLAALSAFDGEAIERFGRPFKELSEGQQTELLTLASTTELGGGRRRRGRHWTASAMRQDSQLGGATLRDHFDYLKGWIGGAYYSSEIGMKELGWTGENFFDSFPVCEHSDGHR